MLNSAGGYSIVVKGNQTYKFQQSDARLYGGELSIDIHPVQWLHFENTASFVLAVNGGGNGVMITPGSKYLLLIPSFHSQTELRINFKRKIGFLNSVYLESGMVYYARQGRVFSVNGTETPASGYILFNAGIGFDVVNQGGKTLAEISLTANNITDVAYQSHLSRLKYFEESPGNGSGHSGIYDMGRNLGIKVIFPLNF